MRGVGDLEVGGPLVNVEIAVLQHSDGRQPRRLWHPNADREYAEGKNQNKLRPEDIEKIEFVFTRKLELPKYSRLVDKDEIVDKHDHNLNIRRYVDNTPDTEPEDVQAHLIGGVPEAEVLARRPDFAKFGVSVDTLFQPERPGYRRFRAAIAEVRYQGHFGAQFGARKHLRRPLRRAGGLVESSP